MTPEYYKKLKKIFQPCLQRNDLQGKWEWISLEWMMEMSNPSPQELINPWKDPWTNQEFQPISLQDLKANIEQQGVIEPFIISVGIESGRARLEGGNHRVHILMDMDIWHAPTICWVGSQHKGSLANGDHEGRAVKFWPQHKPVVQIGAYDERFFEKPSLILPSANPWFPEKQTPPEPQEIKRTRKKSANNT